MRLTTFSDYALRVLIYLGLKSDELATIGEIAQAYGVSKNHLMKVVQQLASQGYVYTVRGKGGGLRLAVSPSEVRLGEVLRETERGSALVECFDPSSSACPIQVPCPLRNVLEEAQAAFFGVLDGYTLADLLASRAQLSPILHLGGPESHAR